MDTKLIKVFLLSSINLWSDGENIFRKINTFKFLVFSVISVSQFSEYSGHFQGLCIVLEVEETEKKLFMVQRERRVKG